MGIFSLSLSCSHLFGVLLCRMGEQHVCILSGVVCVDTLLEHLRTVRYFLTLGGPLGGGIGGSGHVIMSGTGKVCGLGMRIRRKIDKLISGSVLDRVFLSTQLRSSPCAHQDNSSLIREISTPTRNALIATHSRHTEYAPRFWKKAYPNPVVEVMNNRGCGYY